MNKLPLIAALLVTAAVFAQPAPPVLVHGCNDLQGVTVNNSANLPDTKLEISTDAKYVSEGSGCLHLRSVSPKDANGNTYLSLIIATPPVDMRGKALVLEAATSLPDATKALYVRGYNAAGQTVLSWMSWGGPLKATKQTFELTPGVSDGILAWEPGMVKSDDRSAVVRWEVYVGTSTPGAAYDLYLDNLRTVPATVQSFMSVTTAHKLYPDTPLVAGGKPQAIIVAPADKQWAAVADAVAAAIKQATGAALPIKQPDQVTNDDLRQTSAILVGNIVNNRAMLYPYAHSMMFADAVFPGEGGYELRTVSDPWGTGKNLIIIGGTDVAGGKAAADAFAKLLQPGADLTLKRVCDIKLGGDGKSRWNYYFNTKLDDAWVEAMHKQAETSIVNGAHTGLFDQIGNMGEWYALSGQDAYAKVFVWLVRRAKQHVDTKPDTFGGPWGMDSDFMAYHVMPVWAVVEQSPALNDADRLNVSRILYQWIAEDVSLKGAGGADAAAAHRPCSNHGTFAALGTFCAGEYFAKYYNAAEGKHWVGIGDRCFQNLTANTKACEDCNGYQWLTNLHKVKYALMKPDLSIFENGVVKSMADYAVLTMNNLGYQVTYGDTGEWKCWFSEMPVLRAAEWYYRDGRYQWALDRKLKLTGGRYYYGDYNCEATAKQPDDLLGARAWALDPLWYKAEGGSDVPGPQTFDKMAFRQSFDPKDPYLLLDGLSNGGHKHLDGNSVLQWTQNERIWVCDADYYKSLPKYHNTVLIIKDGQSAAIPPFVELENATDLPAAAVSVTKYSNYAGVDWRRSVIQLKNRMFIVADQMIAKEDGDYSFRAVWQTVGNVKVNGNALDIEQGGQWARFATTPDARIVMSDDPVTGKNWASYPYAGKPIVRVMQEVVNRKLKAGQRVTLFTVLQANGEKASTVKVERGEGDDTALITGSGDPVSVDTKLPAQGTMAALMVKSGTTNLNVGDPNVARVDKTSESARAVAQQAAKAPALTTRWSYKDKLTSYLLTNNSDAFEAVDAGAKITCTPQPLAQNVFGGDRNQLSNLTDGLLLTTDGGVMWDVDQQVTLDLKLDQAFDLDRLGLKEWFATSSSRGKRFELARVQVIASNDGFQKDLRTLADVTDKETYGNWGAPSYGPHPYDYPLKGNAKAVRVILTPRPGTAIYLAELQLWGNRPGLEIDLATRLARGVPMHTFNSIKCADLNGDKLDETIAGSSNGSLYCFASDGKLLWKLDCGAAINVVNTVDFNGDGKPTIIAGCMDAKAVAVDAQGKQLWVFNPPYYKRAGHVRVVFPADLQGTGKQSAIIGAENWHYYALDASGKQLWQYESVHASTAGCAANMDGNKKQSIVAGTEYYWWHAINPDGSKRWSYSSGGPCVNAAAAGDLDGNGKQEAIFGGADTLVHVLDATGKELWTFNTGDEVTALKCADVNGDGKDEILASSLSFNVYCLDGTGKLLWRHDLGSEVRSMTTLSTPGGLVVAAGCADGAIEVFNAADGKLLNQYQAIGSVLSLAAGSLKAGAQCLLAGTTDGNLTALGTEK